jgi:DNA adenine methylase
MKPILKYPGAKWRLADWIISNMPPHVGYVEPFFGSGAVFFNKEPSRIETISDIDGSIIRFFRTCRDHPEALSRAIGLTPWSREEFLKSDFGEEIMDDVEAARQLAVRCWMAFGARTAVKNSWRHSTGKQINNGPDCPKIWAKLPDLVVQVGQRLLHAQIDNRPALDVIRNIDGEESLIYVDPPYMKDTRSLNGDQYRFEMSDHEHEMLLKALIENRGMVLISGYDCDLYRDMLRDWQMVSMSTRAERAATRIESLWINPLAAERNAQVSMFCKGGCSHG